MAKTNYYEFDPQDEKIIKIFSGLGMPKNLAKTLMYISNTEECRSADIEHEASLRQPEVSVAMQELQRRGWVKKRDLKKKGKGRPVHLYSLKQPIDNIIKDFEKEKTREIDTIKKDLSDLRELINSRQ